MRASTDASKRLVLKIQRRLTAYEWWQILARRQGSHLDFEGGFDNRTWGCSWPGCDFRGWWSSVRREGWKTRKEHSEDCPLHGIPMPPKAPKKEKR